MTILCYPKCSTSRKAVAWLEAHGLDYDYRDITQARPTEEELKVWVHNSGLPLPKFFNTSGVLYRELGLGAKLPGLSEDEKYALLGSNGLLVKRPLLVKEGLVLVGFREEEWERCLLG